MAISFFSHYSIVSFKMPSTFPYTPRGRIIVGDKPDLEKVLNLKFCDEILLLEFTLQEENLI